MTDPRVVLVAGGTASGKTTLTKQLLEVAAGSACAIAQDSYYPCHGHMSITEQASVNYDSPSECEVELLCAHVGRLLAGQVVNVPVYDFPTHSRSSKTTLVEPKKVIIIEGILTVHFTELRELATYSVFVDTPDDIRFARRMERDIRERGRSAESVSTQWEATVHPMHRKFCEPSKHLASEIFSGRGWAMEDVRALWARIVRAPVRPLA